MATHTIPGAGGVALHVAEHGDPAGRPVLFVHGWSQSELCWAAQYAAAELSAFRLVGLDLRGHGMSARPAGAGAYTDGAAWADDIAAVIDALGLDRPVLVGWSYGGYVVGDYLARHGGDAIAGIDLVGGAVVMRPDIFGTLIGPGFLDNAPAACTPDLAQNIAAVRAFLRACTAAPLPAEAFETCLAFTMVVPPAVRGFLLQRQLDFGAAYAAYAGPLLVSQGRADSIVLPAMADYVLDRCATARASWYDGVGHAPFLEAADRFNRELAAFVRAA